MVSSQSHQYRYHVIITVTIFIVVIIINGRRAFSVAGPKVRNSLPDFIRDSTISADCFRRLLKTYLFARY